MVVVPAATPVTTPEVALIVATVTLLLLHVPPVVASLSVSVEPAHTPATPDIAEGALFTVTTLVTLHPVLNV
jgi:hypothetical protein